MRRAGWLLAVCAACSSELGTRAQAITEGVRDDADPAVARLERGLGPCTATAIAPTVLLTAGHCLEVVPAVAVFGTDPATGIEVAVVRAAVHPRFDRDTLAHDLGLVELAAPAPAEPIAIAEPPPPGSSVRVVGFGVRGRGDLAPAEKRTGTSRVIAVDDAALALAPAPAQPCVGDSGGPVLTEAGIAGVISSGDAACVAGATAMRIDPAFLASFDEPGCATAPGASWGALAALGSALRRRRSR